jgi:hypothetical protein
MLLFTYPRDFRLRFESEMVTTFSDLICGEWEHTGLSGIARVWRSAVAEVFFVAVPLQLKNSIVRRDFAIAAFLACLVCSHISCYVACVQWRVGNWFRASKRLRVFSSVG